MVYVWLRGQRCSRPPGILLESDEPLKDQSQSGLRERIAGISRMVREGIVYVREAKSAEIS